jgi:hypothetical protein
MAQQSSYPYAIKTPQFSRKGHLKSDISRQRQRHRRRIHERYRGERGVKMDTRLRYYTDMREIMDS